MSIIDCSWCYHLLAEQCLLSLTFECDYQLESRASPRWGGGRANIAMPANNDMPMFLTRCEQKCTYGNMAESELLCVRVATLLRNKYASILRVMS